MQKDLNLPIMLFTDFGSAFPSLIHEWFFIILKASGMSDGLFNFIKGIYFIAFAIGKVQADVVIFFLIQSGVIRRVSTCKFLLGCCLRPFLEPFRLRN